MSFINQNKVGNVFPLSKFTTKKPLTVIPLGDSITAANSSYDATNNCWHLAGDGYAEQAVMRAGGKFTILANAGVAGNTSTQIRARLFTDVIDKAPDLCILMAGTNDFYTGMTTSDYQTLFNNIEYMVQQLLGAGIGVVLVSPPGKDATVSGFQEARVALPYYYQIAEFYGLPFVDTHKLVTDPSTGNYLAGYSTDGTHPSGPGVVALATGVANCLSNLDTYNQGLYFPTYTDPSNAQPYNLLMNGNMELQTTANVPDNIAFTGTMPPVTLNGSNPAPLPTMGKNWQVTKTNTTAGYVMYSYPINLSFFTAGDIVRFNGRAKVTGSGTGGFSINASWYTAGLNQPIGLTHLDGEYIFSQDFVAHNDYLIINVYLSDAAAYEFSGFTVINLSAMARIWQVGQQV